MRRSPQERKKRKGDDERVEERERAKEKERQSGLQSHNIAGEIKCLLMES